jgi:hypothetical protein
LRVEVAADLVASPASVDLIEVVAEACFTNPAARREALAISRIWPVVPHGVKLSLGSADGIDRARRLGDLVRDLHAPAISEHVAFAGGGGRELGQRHPAPLHRRRLAASARHPVCAGSSIHSPRIRAPTLYAAEPMLPRPAHAPP